jgi:small subunit ribosomal protein S11e
MADFQDQRAYLKQPAIFQNSKKSLAALGKKRSGIKAAEAAKGGAAEVVTKGRDLKLARYVRNVGLGFKTPASAITGGYIDKKCPFTGNVSFLVLLDYFEFFF